MSEQPRLISLENISKEFDGTTVLDNINLYIRKINFLFFGRNLVAIFFYSALRCLIHLLISIQ